MPVAPYTRRTKRGPCRPLPGRHLSISNLNKQMLNCHYRPPPPFLGPEHKKKTPPVNLLNITRALVHPTTPLPHSQRQVTNRLITAKNKEKNKKPSTQIY
jgi:hypothetical protein